MHLLTKCLILAVFFAAGAFAQNCQIGAPSTAPATGCQKVLGYSGTNLVYVCQARSVQPTSTRITVASATNANPVVFTVSGGHGFNTNALPTVTVSGGTGNWTAVNGSYTATVISSTTFSIPVDSTSLGALAGTVVADTFAPLTTASVWSVLKLVYDGSNNLVWSGYVGGSPAERNTCSAAPTQYQ